MLSLTPARLRGRRRLLPAAALPAALAATALPAAADAASIGDRAPTRTDPTPR